MAVFQQIILDKINGTPIGNRIGRSYANKGIPVEIVTSLSGQSSRNKSPLGAPVFIITTGDETIDGFLGDWHNSRLMSIITKGRIVAAASQPFIVSDIGKAVFCGEDAKVRVANSGGWGEVLDGGIDDEIGDFYYLDINFPQDER